MDFLSRAAAWCIATFAFVMSTCGAEHSRTQQVSLQRGWNAVFLEVAPENTDPAAVFTGIPVDVVATYLSRSSSAQFLTDSGAKMFKDAGWGVWYAESRPDAFLKTLHTIAGMQAYLIRVTADCVWSVTGTVQPQETTWTPNSYNLVGFSVHAQAPPTFAQFFSGSGAHNHNKIYRLANGAWRRVSNPAAETMRSGEAFWIYCQGNSTYRGPVRVETKTRHGVLLNGGTSSLTLRNETGYPISSTLEHIVQGTNSVPLSIVIQVMGGSNTSLTTVAAPLPRGAWTQSLPPLEAGNSMGVPFELRQQDAQSALVRSLLKVSTDIGTVIWVPVTGLRKDLQEN